MSFSVSNISSNNITSVSLSGSNGIASIDSGGIYYTNNLGANWTQSSGITGNFDSVFLSGSNGIAGSSSFDGLYYSIDSGVNWTQSDFTIGGTTSGNFFTVALSGTNAIAATSTDDNGIYYSINSGQTWTQSINLTTGNFNSVALSSDGTKGIAGSNSALGLYYTTNSGVTWTRSDLASGGPTENDFYSVSLSGTNAIAGSMSGTGIYYSTNSGQTWTQTAVNIGDFYSVFLSGANGIAGSGNSNDGIYYTTNSGVTWTKSSLASGNFVVALSGSIAVATSSDWFATGTGTGIYKSLDYGQNWTGAGVNSGAFNSLSLSGSRAIAGGSTNNGIYYASSSLCYEKNTLILVLENEIEVYKKICELKVGDTVKTYKHGYKKIKMIKSFNYNTYNITRLKRCVYRMKEHDIIVTGKHGLLVDELTQSEIKNIKKCGIILRNIDDKQVLPACASDKFEKITNIFDFELWHFVLENDDESRNYGIYITDGILSESCSEKAFLNE
jgi:hypothetical protein